MGPTSKVHKIYYRLPNDVYQTAKVSKLLLLNENGGASQFKGKRLDEIEINLDTIDEEPSGDEDHEAEKVSDLDIPKNEEVKVRLLLTSYGFTQVHFRQIEKYNNLEFYYFIKHIFSVLLLRATSA